MWTIAYSERHDFEDIEAFGCKGQRHMLLAATGENFYWRPEVRLLVLAEPELGQIQVRTDGIDCEGQ